MAKKSKKVEITSDDLKGHSLNEMLQNSYGKKGTPARITAEKRIKEKAKNLLSDNKKKEAKENEEKKSLKKRIKKIKVQINYIHYRKGKKVKTTKGSVSVNQDTFNALKGLQEAKKKEALFFKFAKEFSKNAARLSAGDKFPSIYRSNDSEFIIDYYFKIKDRNTGKIIPSTYINNKGKIAPIPARISLETGVIEVSKEAFVKLTIPNRIRALLSLYAKWVNKNELNKDGKQKSGKSIKSNNVIGSPKKTVGNKARAGKKNAVRKRNSKK